MYMQRPVFKLGKRLEDSGLADILLDTRVTTFGHEKQTLQSNCESYKNNG